MKYVQWHTFIPGFTKIGKQVQIEDIRTYTHISIHTYIHMPACIHTYIHADSIVIS
jgi:hypothetical protein